MAVYRSMLRVKCVLTDEWHTESSLATCCVGFTRRKALLVMRLISMRHASLVSSALPEVLSCGESECIGCRSRRSLPKMPSGLLHHKLWPTALCALFFRLANTMGGDLAGDVHRNNPKESWIRRYHSWGTGGPHEHATGKRSILKGLMHGHETLRIIWMQCGLAPWTGPSH